MFSYQHIFHAGNFADVHKHAALCLMIKSLLKKPSAWCYVDSHAGRGYYDLTSAAAQKTGEYRVGIGQVWQKTAFPPALEPYMTAVRAHNSTGNLQCYPGSPGLVRHFLRPSDRMILIEAHPNEIQHLRQQMGSDRHVAIHQRDAYEGLVALLPPHEKRGVVLMDPPYELEQDYQQVSETLVYAYKRWPQASYLIWYPLLAARGDEKLKRILQRSGLRNILCSELWNTTNDKTGNAKMRSNTYQGLLGSGLLVVNPPWQLDKQLAQILPVLGQWLCDSLTAGWVKQWIPE